MTAYESLNRVRSHKVAYDRLVNKVECLTALAERSTPVLSGMPKAGARHGQTDETWAALADYRRECEQELISYITESKRLELELNCIKSTRVRTAMKYRYIDLLKIPAIADQMAMNERNVYNLLKRGRMIYEKHWEGKNE